MVRLDATKRTGHAVRTIAMAGATALSLVFAAACGGGGGDKAGAATELTILFHSQDSPLQKKFTEDTLIAGFERNNPDIHIKPTWTADPRSIIVQQPAAGAGPDILITDGSADVQLFAQKGRSSR